MQEKVLAKEQENNMNDEYMKVWIEQTETDANKRKDKEE
jgi:hypothetical protein